MGNENEIKTFTAVDSEGKEVEMEIIAAFVNEQVINNPACGVKHHTVKTFAVFHTANIVCENVIYKTLCIRTFDFHFTHVRNVKNAAMITHRIVFFYNAFVLNWHIKTSERTHLSSKCRVARVEAGLL